MDAQENPYLPDEELIRHIQWQIRLNLATSAQQQFRPSRGLDPLTASAALVVIPFGSVLLIALYFAGLL